MKHRDPSKGTLISPPFSIPDSRQSKKNENATYYESSSKKNLQHTLTFSPSM